MASDISANIQVMLTHALDDKVEKLRSVSGFDRMGLTLLNTYFFGDDIAEVAKCVCIIFSENSKYSIIDLVFYVTNGNLRVIYDKRAEAAQ